MSWKQCLLHLQKNIIWHASPEDIFFGQNVTWSAGPDPSCRFWNRFEQRSGVQDKETWCSSTLTDEMLLHHIICILVWCTANIFMSHSSNTANHLLLSRLLEFSWKNYFLKSLNLQLLEGTLLSPTIKVEENKVFLVLPIFKSYFET